MTNEQDVLELAQNAAFLDELYEQYRKNPASVDPSWRAVFDSGELPVYTPPAGNGANGRTNGHANGSAYANGNGALVERRAADYEPRFARVYSLVDAYRKASSDR